MEHYHSWFTPDCTEELLNFNTVCRKRALRGGPVLYITVVMDRGLLKLDGKADYFFQMGKIPLRGKALAKKEQTYLDKLPECPPGVMEKAQVYGQTSFRDW